MTESVDQKYRKVAIVTGGSRGIGRRIAERLAQAGYAIVLSYRSDDARANAVIAEITNAGGKAHAVRGDIADEQTIAALFDNARTVFGGVDLVVNAAAVLLTKPLTELSVAEIDEMLGSNLRGAILLNREAAKNVRAGGSIINLSSAVTLNYAPGYSAYAATKAGLEVITKVLARELRGRDITVNAVAPGPTETEMLTADLARSADGEAMRKALIDAIPLGRLGRPDDIAEIVLALAGPARWVNGQVVHASGGLV